jgi:hypothetical protein
LLADPITYNGLLLDASIPQPENRTLPNTCQWAIDIENNQRNKSSKKALNNKSSKYNLIGFK